MIQVVLSVPEKQVCRVDAQALIVPADEGEMGIGQNHVDLVTRLQPGVLRVKSAQREDVYFISRGILRVSGNVVEVAVQYAEEARGIDLTRVNSSKKRALDRLKSRDGYVDFDRALGSLRRSFLRETAAKAVKAS
jgi:F-type H+-transporting ATPase subunit epsilon